MPTLLGETTIQMPSGYQSLIREIEFNPSQVLIDQDALLGNIIITSIMDIFINGSGAKQNTNISLKITEGARYPLFFTVPDNAIVMILLKLEQDIYTGTGEGYNVDIILHSNLIIDDGRPDNYIVSTVGEDQ